MYKRKFNIYLIIEGPRAKVEFNFNGKEKSHVNLFLSLRHAVSLSSIPLRSTQQDR